MRAARTRVGQTAVRPRVLRGRRSVRVRRGSPHLPAPPLTAGGHVAAPPLRLLLPIPASPRGSAPAVLRAHRPAPPPPSARYGAGSGEPGEGRPGRDRAQPRGDRPRSAWGPGRCGEPLGRSVTGNAGPGPGPRGGAGCAVLGGARGRDARGGAAMLGRRFPILPEAAARCSAPSSPGCHWGQGPPGLLCSAAAPELPGKCGGRGATGRGSPGGARPRRRQ